MIPEINVALVITGESVTAELVDKFRSMGATECWMHGDSKQGTALTYPHNGCKFGQDPVSSYDVEEVSFPFLERIVANTELMQVIRENQLSPMLDIWAYASDVIPGIVLDVQHVQLLAEHNMSFEIDLILTSEDLPEA